MASSAADLLIRILGDSRSAVDSMLGLRRNSESSMTAVRSAVRAATTQLSADADRTRQALTGMFDNVRADQLIAQLQAGGRAGDQAAREIMQALGSIQSEADRTAAGLSIFGDAWPDIERRANQSMDSIQRSLRDVSGRANTEAGQMRQALSGIFDDVTADRLVRELQAGGEAGERAAREISQALAQVENDVDRNRRGLVIFGDAWRDVERDAQRALRNIRDDLRDTDAEASDLKGTITGMLAGGAGLGLAAGIDSATSSMGHLRAITGATGDEAKELENAVWGVYKSILGLDQRGAVDAVGMVNKSLGLTGDELEHVSKGVGAVVASFDHMGADVNNTTGAVRVLKNTFPELEDSARKALDFIVTGFQSAAGQDDWLDTLTEYSQHFKDIGLTATDMLNWINSGMNSGARNTDILADSVHELNRIFSEEMERAQDALYQIFPADEAERLIRDINAGGEAGREAFYTIAQGLANVNDPAKQATLSVELFGDMAGELSPVMDELLPKFVDGKDKTIELAGATESLKEEYSGFYNLLTKIGRTMYVSFLTPLGDAVPIITGVIDIGAKLGITLLGLSALGIDTTNVVGKLSIAFGVVEAAISSLVSVAIRGLIAAFGFILTPAGLVIVAITAMAGLAYLVMKNWEPIKTFFTDLWDAVKYVFETTVEAMKAPFKSFVNFVLGGVNAIIGGLNKLQVSVPKWVPGIGGNAWGVNISQIPMLAKGGDIVSPGWAIVGEKGPELGYFPRGAGVRPLPPGGGGIQRMEVTGTIIHKGVNDRNQLMGAVEAVMDQFRREVRV